MSLDFYLEYPQLRIASGGPKIFVRRNGQNVEINREEWDRLNPGREPVTFDAGETSTVYGANITHNLGKMAAEAGIYDCLWRPEENGIVFSDQMVRPLESGIAQLKSDRKHYERFNPENGWGDYDGLVRFAEAILAACREYPSALVRASR
jgi:hypothetical protein